MWFSPSSTMVCPFENVAVFFAQNEQFLTIFPRSFQNFVEQKKG